MSVCIAVQLEHSQGTLFKYAWNRPIQRHFGISIISSLQGGKVLLQTQSKFS